MHYIILIYRGAMIHHLFLFLVKAVVLQGLAIVGFLGNYTRVTRRVPMSHAPRDRRGGGREQGCDQRISSRRSSMGTAYIPISPRMIGRESKLQGYLTHVRFSSRSVLHQAWTIGYTTLATHPSSTRCSLRAEGTHGFAAGIAPFSRYCPCCARCREQVNSMP